MPDTKLRRKSIKITGATSHFYGGGPFGSLVTACDDVFQRSELSARAATTLSNVYYSWTNLRHWKFSQSSEKTYSSRYRLYPDTFHNEWFIKFGQPKYRGNIQYILSVYTFLVLLRPQKESLVGLVNIFLQRGCSQTTPLYFKFYLLITWWNRKLVISFR